MAIGAALAPNPTLAPQAVLPILVPQFEVILATLAITLVAVALVVKRAAE